MCRSRSSSMHWRSTRPFEDESRTQTAELRDRLYALGQALGEGLDGHPVYEEHPLESVFAFSRKLGVLPGDVLEQDADVMLLYWAWSAGVERGLDISGRS